MSDKTFRKGLFKRIIDLGIVKQAEVDDLVKIWRVGTGDEKAISLANFVNTVDRDLGTGGSSITELVAELDAQVTALEGEVDVLQGNITTLDNSLNNKVRALYIDPDNLSGTGTLEQQICDYINANLTIEYTRQYSKLNIVLGTDPYPEQIVYGSLYNWYAGTDARNIANTGWSVPDMTKYQALADYLGAGGSYASNTVGAKLKSLGLDYWLTPNSGATNEVAFNARGAGNRSNTAFANINTIMGAWTTTEPFGTTGASIFLYNNSQNFPCRTDSGEAKTFGYSIRLIKDSTTLAHGESGTYVGNDGRVYRTICINNQEWLADNLAETLYRNGDPIPEITDSTAWGNLTTGARCFYDNNEENAYSR